MHRLEEFVRRALCVRRDMWLVGLFGLIAVLSGCSSGAADDDALSVTVSIIPQETFVEAIGGDHVDVTVMVPPGSEPATYEPTSQQLTALSESAAYFQIDVPFERAWMERFRSANSEMTLIDTTTGIERRVFDNGKPDPHIWLSPSLVEQQARTYARALQDLDPDHADDYRAGLQSFLRDIRELDEDLAETLAPHAGQSFMIFHPAMDYFAEAYGLEPINIESGGSEPSAADMQRLIETGRDEAISAVFVEPQFSQRAARSIADQLSAEVIELDPLAADWAANLRAIGRALASSFDTP